jgi:hypothetical protein
MASRTLIRRQALRGLVLILVTGLIGLALTLHRAPQLGFSGPGAGRGGPKAIEQGVFVPYLLRREVKPPPNTDPDRTVVFGTHIENVYEVSLRDRSFRIEGWYWLRWPQAINAILDEQQIATTKIIEFTNLIDSSEMTLEPVQPVPSRLDNGDFLQEFRFSAGLYITDIDLHSFPFTKLSLPVIVEFRPDELACPAPNRIGCIGLRSEPSSEEGTLGQFVAINGYTIGGVWIKELLHQYPTRFGRSTIPSFASIRLDIAYHAEHFAAFTTYIFPLLILVGMALMSPFLPAALGDVRLAIPTTILLTLIFLQLGYRQERPPQSYLSYLDWLYLYAYLVSAVLFALFCWSTHHVSRVDDQEERASVTRQIDRVDSLFQWLAGATLAVLLLWMLLL